MSNLHQYLTRLAVNMGPRNPLIQAMLRVRCRPASLAFSEDKLEIRRDNRAIRIAAKHFPYAVDMAHSFDMYFSQVVPDRQSQYDVVDYSGPKLQRYANGLEFEIASIPEETEAIEGYFHWYRPQTGDTAFDIGAYCGVSTYFFSQCVGSAGKVVAFEPDPLNYSLLLRNIARHGLTNVEPVQAGVAGRSELAAFSSEGTMGSMLQRQSTRVALGTIETVQMFSLADACARYGIPAFAKVDIEGSEIEMLSAAQDFLGRHDIQFALDTNHWIDGKLTNVAVEHIFRECRYEAESSAECGAMTTWARRR